MPNILVPIKYTLQVENLVIDPRSGKVSEEETPKQMGDMDKRALEEALKIKEKHGGKVTAICVGESDATKILREALAMGADEAVLVKCNDLSDTHVVATIISEFYRKRGPYDIILMGAISTDSFTATLGSRIASSLNTPILPFANKIEVNESGVEVESELGDGTYRFTASFPTIITVTLEINEPRIPTLRDILKAKRMKIEEITASDLGLAEIGNKIEIVDVKAYEEKRKQIILDASDPSKVGEVIDQLIKHLKEEGLL